MESIATADWTRILGVVALGAAAWFGVRVLLRVVRAALITRVKDAEDRAAGSGFRAADGFCGRVPAGDTGQPDEDRRRAAR